MKNILHPTDFSKEMHSAFEYCVQFAKRVQGNIVLMHVNPLVETMNIPYGYIHVAQESWEKQAHEKYAKLQKEIAEMDPNMDSKLVTPLGGIVDEILEAVESENIDWIIMGTQGAEGLDKWLGTHASNVVSRAKCPVLVIPENYEFGAIDKIVYATKYLEEDKELLKQAAQLAGFMEAELVILHVDFDPYLTYEEKKFIWFQEKIKKELPELGLVDVSFEFLNHHDLQRALNEFVVFNEADMLIMTRTKRSLFQRLIQRSESTEMTFHPAVPTLIYQQGYMDGLAEEEQEVETVEDR